MYKSVYVTSFSSSMDRSLRRTRVRQQAHGHLKKIDLDYTDFIRRLLIWGFEKVHQSGTWMRNSKQLDNV